jgi:hypothetical protein
MAFGKLGAMGRGMGHLGSLGGVSSPTALARAFTAQLAAGTADQVLAISSDSTANENTEHVFLTAKNRIAPAFPAYLCQIQTFSDASQTYSVNTNGFSGCFGEVLGSTLFEDTFDRADGSLGTTTSNGDTWAANSWTISGNKAVAAASGNLISNATVASDNLVAEALFIAQATGNYRIEGLYLSASDYGVFVQWNLTGATLFVKTGAGTVNLASVSIATTAGTEYTARLIVKGLWVGVNINGYTCGAYLTSTQKAALGDKVYFAAPASNTAFNRVSVKTLTNTRSLKIYNGSVAGSAIDYHDSRIALMLPERPSCWLVALGHNKAGTDTADHNFARLVAYDANVKATYPGLSPVVCTENARLDALASEAAARFAAIRAGWRGRGWGFCDIEAAFTALGGSLSSYLAGDSLHPNALGEALWSTTESDHFGF